MLLHACFVLSRRILDHLCVGRDRMKGRQDRQHGDSGADPLGQGDTVLDSFPGEFRPVRWYQNISIDRLLLGHDLSAQAHSQSHFASRLRMGSNSRRRLALISGKADLKFFKQTHQNKKTLFPHWTKPKLATAREHLMPAVAKTLRWRRTRYSLERSRLAIIQSQATGTSRPIAIAVPRTCGLPIETLGHFIVRNDRSGVSEVHATHSAHTSTGTARHRWALLLRQLGNHRLCGNQ
jgi:hypothetical protein